MLGRSRHSSSHEGKTRCTGDTHNSAPQATAKKTRPEILTRTQHGPHTTRKGTNGHVTMYIMYITEISHWVHPNVRIRVSIKLHLQCHLSIASSHCTALPIPLQHHSPASSELGELAREHHGWFLDGIRFPSTLTMPNLGLFRPSPLHHLIG